MELLRRLCEAPGIPGYEIQIRKIIEEELKGHVESLATDALGSVIAHKPGEGPVVVVAGHMDEIGFFVSHIEEETGFLRINPAGGFDPVNLVAQRVIVHAESGDLIGCIGRKPVHILQEEERKKPLDLRDLFVDIGLSADAVAGRVRVGDTVTLRQDFIRLGDLISCKALDDRAGVYVGIEALKRAKRPACDLYFVGTTQEEVGLRGAQVAGFATHPQIGIALDVTIAADTPGVLPKDRVTELGKGVAIKVRDGSSISHPALVRAARTLADDNGIPYQMEILPHGGTDAGALQMAQEGSAVITLSIPTRYVHSVVEALHPEDLEATIQLLVALIENADTIDLAG